MLNSIDENIVITDSSGTYVTTMIGSYRDDEPSFPLSDFKIVPNSDVFEIDKYGRIATKAPLDQSIYKIKIKARPNPPLAMTPEVEGDVIVKVSRKITISENTTEDSTDPRLVARTTDESTIFSNFEILGDTDFYIINNDDPTKFGNVYVKSGILDYETKSVYILRIKLTEKTNNNTHEVSLTIHVDDVNESPLLVNKAIQLIENHAVGSAVHQLEAEDKDSDDQFECSLTYTIISGNVGNTFKLNNNGLIILNKELDFESMASYHLRIKVTDRGGLTDESTLRIQILDLNEPPYFEDKTVTIRGDLDVGAVVTRLSAFDADAGDNVTFSFEEDSDLFDIDATTGQVTVHDPGYKFQSSHMLIRATDRSELFSIRTLTVHVDNIPYFAYNWHVAFPTLLQKNQPFEIKVATFTRIGTLSETPKLSITCEPPSLRKLPDGTYQFDEDGDFDVSIDLEAADKEQEHKIEPVFLNVRVYSKPDIVEGWSNVTVSEETPVSDTPYIWYKFEDRKYSKLENDDTLYPYACYWVNRKDEDV